MAWVGMTVRNVDGRRGTIRGEWVGFCHRALDIRYSDGTNGYIQLNASGPDTGDTGVQWLCANFSGGPSWPPLGHHSGCSVEPDTTT